MGTGFYIPYNVDFTLRTAPTFIKSRGRNTIIITPTIIKSPRSSIFLGIEVQSCLNLEVLRDLFKTCLLWNYSWQGAPSKFKRLNLEFACCRSSALMLAGKTVCREACFSPARIPSKVPNAWKLGTSRLLLKKRHRFLISKPYKINPKSIHQSG